ARIVRPPLPLAWNRDPGFRSLPQFAESLPMRFASHARRAFVVALFVVIAGGGTARAQTYNWDPAGNGSASGGTGTWDTSNALWFNGTGDVAWPGAGNVAVFGGTAGTVT